MAIHRRMSVGHVHVCVLLLLSYIGRRSGGYFTLDQRVLAVHVYVPYRTEISSMNIDKHPCTSATCLSGTEFYCIRRFKNSKILRHPRCELSQTVHRVYDCLHRILGVNSDECFDQELDFECTSQNVTPMSIEERASRREHCPRAEENWS